MTLPKSNTLKSSIRKDEIHIGIISGNSKGGKSMLTNLLHQTEFMNRNQIFKNEKFTFINDKSIIIRKISTKKLKNNDPDSHQWITKSDIVLLIIRDILTLDDYKIASLRNLSEKKTLFIIRMYINELKNNNQNETLIGIKDFIWSHLGEFLINKTHIYLISNYYDDIDKWDFLRFKDDLIKECIIVRIKQIKNSINQYDDQMLNTEKQSLIEYIELNGLNRIQQYFISRLKRWEQCALNIAVTGQSGAGKSSFINAIRGVTPESDDFAPTDFIECTAIPTAYHHPMHRNLTFWDLPGCGTPTYPCKTYLDRIDFEKYDIVIIICSGRFSENDDWLAEEMSKIQKSYLFLRTKIDIDIQNAKRDSPPPFNEDKLLEKIRMDCLKHLNNKTFNQKVYLISNNRKYVNKWDMDGFLHDLREFYPQLKRESLVFSMNNTSREVIKAKVEYLRKRTWFLASVTAVAAVLPLPGFSMGINVLACITEAKEYRQQLGLHNQAVERLARLKNISTDYIRDTINSILPILDETVFEDIFKQKLLSVSAALGHCVPIMGSVFSLKAVAETLNYFLTLMEKAALSIIDIHFDDIASKNLTTNSENILID